MAVTHAKVSATPSIPGSWIQPTDWNNFHVVRLLIDGLFANGSPSAITDVVEGTGGSGGITVTLNNPGASEAPPLYAMKMDAAAGPVTFVDSASANFLGAGGLTASYALVNQGQWAIFIWDTTQWLVFGV